MWFEKRVIFDTSKKDYKMQNNYFIRLQQMTKYFVMRECENIPTWISLCVTIVFSQPVGISVFKFSKSFLEIS